LVSWENDVDPVFPLVGKLTTPWRWENAGTRILGDWLLDARTRLEQGKAIDVRTAKEGVTWVQLDGTNDRLICLSAVRTLASHSDGRVLVIGDSTNAAMRQEFASQTPGAMTVEPVDLKDLFAFAEAFSPEAPKALEALARFAQSVMTNLGTAAVGTLLPRVSSLQRGSAKKPPTPVENAALVFDASRDFPTAIRLLAEIRKQPGVRAYRPEVLRACIKAFQLCGGTDRMALQEAVTRVREQHRFSSRPLPKLAVGSTLLLKGQEAEVVVILNAGGLNARNLYVAMTRGSKTVAICSRDPVLTPYSA